MSKISPEISSVTDWSCLGFLNSIYVLSLANAGLGFPDTCLRHCCTWCVDNTGKQIQIDCDTVLDFLSNSNVQN